MKFISFALFSLICGHFCSASTAFILDSFKRCTVRDGHSSATFNLLAKQCEQAWGKSSLPLEQTREITKLAFDLEGTVSDKKDVSMSMILLETLRISSLSGIVGNLFVQTSITSQLDNHQVGIPKFFPNKELVSNIISEACQFLLKSISTNSKDKKTVIYPYILMTVTSHTLNVLSTFTPLYIDGNNHEQVKEMLRFFGDVYDKLKSTIHHINRAVMEIGLIENNRVLRRTDAINIRTVITPNIPSIFKAGPLTTKKWTIDMLDLIHQYPSSARLIVENVQQRQLNISFDRLLDGEIKDRLQKIEDDDKQQPENYPVYLNFKNPALAYFDKHSQIMVGLHPILHLLMNHFISTRVSNPDKLPLLHRFCLADLVGTIINSHAMHENEAESGIPTMEVAQFEAQFKEMVWRIDQEFFNDFNALCQVTLLLRLEFTQCRIFMHSVEVKPSMSALEMVEYLAKMVQLCDKFKSQSGMSNVRAAIVNVIKVSVPVLKKWIGLEESKLIKVLKPIF